MNRKEYGKQLRRFAYLEQKLLGSNESRKQNTQTVVIQGAVKARVRLDNIEKWKTIQKL